MNRRIVVMGVSGCGKSTLGAALAQALGASFVDADDLHPATNIAKMRAGLPLTDEDRAPWLGRVAEALAQDPVVIACSALKRAYRDYLRQGLNGVVFVHPTGPAAIISARLSQRQGHFMPPGLLESQYATLEPLEPNEAAIAVSVALPLEVQVQSVLITAGSVSTPLPDSRNVQQYQLQEVQGPCSQP